MSLTNDLRNTNLIKDICKFLGWPLVSEFNRKSVPIFGLHIEHQRTMIIIKSFACVGKIARKCKDKPDLCLEDMTR